ncbi:twin-arginine translocation signal domain-containing protein [Halostagnicola kamekurae]|uniref:Copper binding protein, plastocyanin/azurin family n=1 Tax=Halostagnicola kamekurae TaxID=619731 RepID=A0A1I6NYA1_9EURY|nr:twin-arginine translocation signal domain-containing protein [Halostagnicola kamekurae]SFS32901.1 Copper binding protein, plastocyanin/azurin family [Halostagnicola kamekurae]
MARKRTVSRRTALKVTGTAAATALVAGCSGGGDNGGDGNGDDGDSGSEEYEISPDQEITLIADSGGWVGSAPDAIADVENPTLALQSGEEYNIGWSEANDELEHNLEIRNDSGEVVKDLETDLVAQPDERIELTFEPSEETTVYRCDPHSAMEGSIVLQ